MSAADSILTREQGAKRVAAAIEALASCLDVDLELDHLAHVSGSA